MAVVYNTTIDQGADWYFNITYADPNGTPINITGSSAKCQLRSNPNSPSAVLTLDSDTGGIDIIGAQGEVNLHATAAETGAIDEGTYFYDVEITSDQDVVTRLVQGQIVVSAEVTR